MKVKKPNLTPKIVVSILISSDFLQMKKLVKICLQFCHDNINAVIKAPTNMNCITSKLLSRLCDLFEHKDLGLVKDPKDKFISKLFWKKLERAFSRGQPAASLFFCKRCQRVVNKEYTACAPCVGDGLGVSREGRFTFSHVPDTSWDVNMFLAAMRIKRMSASDIYWRVWGTAFMFSFLLFFFSFSSSSSYLRPLCAVSRLRPSLLQSMLTTVAQLY